MLYLKYGAAPKNIISLHEGEFGVNVYEMMHNISRISVMVQPLERGILGRIFHSV